MLIDFYMRAGILSIAVYISVFSFYKFSFKIRRNNSIFIYLSLGLIYLWYLGAGYKIYTTVPLSIEVIKIEYIEYKRNQVDIDFKNIYHTRGTRIHLYKWSLLHIRWNPVNVYM